MQSKMDFDFKKKNIATYLVVTHVITQEYGSCYWSLHNCYWSLLTF